MAPLSENALLLSYGNLIDSSINEKIIALHKALAAKPFPGFIESVPAYASLAVFYDAIFIRYNQPNIKTAFEVVKKYIIELVAEISETAANKAAKIISIPVYYNGADLEYVATINQLTIEEVIKIHTSVNYRVFMTGFLPGFAYMGTVDEKIITPRKETPRLHVAAGSVGIAGAQTGIYPIDSPGGWQIIGKTALSIFDKNKPDPCLLKAGDEVQFFSINKNEFEKENEH
ncbi:MAG: 5-oxoprolinase subunit PxpB [Ferruginibacter sp.]